MSNSVTNVQTQTNQIAAMVSQLQGNDGKIALALMRVRRGCDARVQALRDIVADELREHRRIVRSKPLDNGASIVC